MRHFAIRPIIGILSLLMLTATAAFAAQGGLAERRAMTAYQEAKYPEQLKAIQTAAGFEVPVEVQWDGLMLEDQAENFQEPWYLTDVYFSPLAGALKKVTADDMGKSALKAGLKKIVIRYDEATAPASSYTDGLTFEGGVLTLNYKPGANGSPDQAELRAEAIQKFLESKL